MNNKNTTTNTVTTVRKQSVSNLSTQRIAKTEDRRTKEKPNY